MNQRKTGEYVLISNAGDESCNAFVPYPLPSDPPLIVDSGLQATIDRALVSLITTFRLRRSRYSQLF
ncbi:MAG: hypothetical protein ACMUIL_12940 [bacterium]